MTSITETQFYVYILTASDDTVLYVGHTADPDRRMREHANKSWAPEVFNVEVFEAVDKANALFVERRLIAETRAKYNTQSKLDPIKEFVRKERELYDLLAGN